MFKSFFFAILLMGMSTMCLYAQVNIHVDVQKTIGKMHPAWAWFGYDEPNYTYMKDGKKLLAEIAAMSPVPVYVRTHSLMVTGDGTPALKWGSTNMYTEDAQGNPIYNWKIVDSIFDTYVRLGMKPLAQIGFMPQALSTHPDPYRHYWKPGDPYTDIITGWAYPPKDYNKWAELVYQWVRHCAARYGEKEVASWYWELWNEPNGHYWKGTMEEFLKLYDYTADAVKRALPTARIGGNNIAGTAGADAQRWLKTFIDHCLTGVNYKTGQIGAPLDAVLFHAKGSPTRVGNHVRMNMGLQLRDIETGFKMVASYPSLKNIPIIIGESDPEGCAACGMATNPENAYRNGTMYSSYTAASFARIYAMAEQYQVNFKGAVSWSFEFENQPWFYGFRDLATNGVDKPVLNVFRMFSKMKGDRVALHSDQSYSLRTAIDSSLRGKTSDVFGFATKDQHDVAIMLWNHHDDDIKGDTVMATLKVEGLTQKTVTLTCYQIDDTHSNSYELWKKMGSPQQPTAAQITELEKGGKLEKLGDAQKLLVKDQVLTYHVALPRQAVTLLKLVW